MNKLTAIPVQSDGHQGASRIGAATAETDAAAARMVARVRLLMAVSGFTTLIAVAAVIGVIGYRVYRAGGAGAASEVVITLPKGARVAATSVAEDRIVVTLDVAGATEIRTYDLKTLKETGRIRFATEP